jgi:hypothetical protein
LNIDIQTGNSYRMGLPRLPTCWEIVTQALKIDRSFVLGMRQNQDGLTIVYRAHAPRSVC